LNVVEKEKENLFLNIWEEKERIRELNTPDYAERKNRNWRITVRKLWNYREKTRRCLRNSKGTRKRRRLTRKEKCHNNEIERRESGRNWNEEA
jgi:hypothetical protein